MVVHYPTPGILPPTLFTLYPIGYLYLVPPPIRYAGEDRTSGPPFSGHSWLAISCRALALVLLVSSSLDRISVATAIRSTSRLLIVIVVVPSSCLVIVMLSPPSLDTTEVTTFPSAGSFRTFFQLDLIWRIEDGKCSRTRPPAGHTRQSCGSRTHNTKPLALPTTEPSTRIRFAHLGLECCRICSSCRHLLVQNTKS